MKSFLGILASLPALAMLVALASPASAQADPFAEHRAKAERLCNDLKQQAKDLAGRAEKLPDPKVRAEAEKSIKQLETLVTNTEQAIAKGPEQLGIAPREYAERLVSIARAGNWQVQQIEQQAFGKPPSIGARLNLPSKDDFKEKMSRGFDHSPNNYTPSANATPPVGGSTEFFRARGSFQATDRETAVEIDRRDGHLGGGVLLEGTASGLGTIDGGSVRYDPRLLAITFNGNSAYFLNVAPLDARAICRQVADDKLGRIGVSMSAPTYLVFGDNGDRNYRDTQVALDLVLVDSFLADTVFNKNNWNVGYRYLGNFKPKSSAATEARLVRWAFKDFDFSITNGRVHLVGASAEARIIPIAATLGPNGEFHPDEERLAKGYSAPAEEMANAQHLADNMEYYKRERIIARVFAHGETAAFCRALKQAGANLVQLTQDM